MSWLSDLNKNIADALEPVDNWICDYPDTYLWYLAFVFIIAAGILFLVKFKAMQVTTLPEQVKLLKPAAVVSDESDGKKHHMISSFQAFCVSMGARVGVGNIAGVTAAIIMGGAGAVFWMWIFALLGAATSFVECTLAQLFKEKTVDGNLCVCKDGPVFNIKKLLWQN